MSGGTPRAFLRELETSGALAPVARPVAPGRDLAAVAFAAYDRLGKATMFGSIEGFPGWRAAGHLLADRAQWACAFGEPAAGLLPALRPRLAGTLAAAWIRPEEAPLSPADGSAGLRTIPVPLMAEHDAGPQLTAVAVVRHPDGAGETVGLARLQVCGDDQLLWHDMPPALAAMHRTCRQAGAPMPVSFAIGAPPALYLAAAVASGRRQTDLGLAGALGQTPIRVMPAGKAAAPADSEYVVVGDVLAETDAAPLSNVLDTCGAPQTTHVVRSAALYRRRDPIHWSVAPAGLMALATELLVWEHIRNIEGGLDVRDVCCLPCAGALVAVIKLRPRVQGQAKTALLGSLAGPAYWVKLVIGVDEDIDSGSLRDVLWSVASRTHARDDVGVVDGVRMLHADPSAAFLDGDPSGERVGSRWYIDSTMPAVSQPERRATFQRAIPRNFARVNLADYARR